MSTKIWLFIAALTLAILMWMPRATLAQRNCDPSYPTVCIPSPPPDLDCGEIEHRSFRVVGNDPHRFDGDRDGIGCEAN